MQGLPLAGEQGRVLEPQLVEGARRPALQIGHLDAGGGVYLVGGNHQAIKQNGPQDFIAGSFPFNTLADGLDAGAVMGLNKARLLAVGAGKPAAFALEPLQPLQDGLEALGRVPGSVGLHQRLG